MTHYRMKFKVTVWINKGTYQYYLVLSNQAQLDGIQVCDEVDMKVKQNLVKL